VKALRIGIVGLGYWGPNLVRNFAALPDVDVAWLCDLDAARLEGVGRPFRAGRKTTRFEDLLEDATLDAVVLATPIATHRPLGEAALEAGKHLWVEKPLAGSVADAAALVERARARERCLLVDHTFIYAPAVAKVRELVSQGELGEVLYFDSVRVNLGIFQSDASVIWDLGPHDLSIARAVLGKSPSRISCVAFRHVPGAHESMAYVTLRYEGTLVAHFHESWLAPVKLRQTLIGGTRRMILYNELDPMERVRVYDRGVDVRHGSADAEARRRALVSYRSGDLWSPRIEQHEPLAVAARDFVEAIRQRRAPLVDGEAGLEVVRALEAAQRSIERDGAFVDVR
jgi:predicted dehydrogenase